MDYLEAPPDPDLLPDGKPYGLFYLKWIVDKAYCSGPYFSEKGLLKDTVDFYQKGIPFSAWRNAGETWQAVHIDEHFLSQWAQEYSLMMDAFWADRHII